MIKTSKEKAAKKENISLVLKKKQVKKGISVAKKKRSSVLKAVSKSKLCSSIRSIVMRDNKENENVLLENDFELMEIVNDTIPRVDDIVSDYGDSDEEEDDEENLIAELEEIEIECVELWLLFFIFGFEIISF